MSTAPHSMDQNSFGLTLKTALEPHRDCVTKVLEWCETASDEHFKGPKGPARSWSSQCTPEDYRANTIDYLTSATEGLIDSPRDAHALSVLLQSAFSIANNEFQSHIAADLYTIKNECDKIMPEGWESPGPTSLKLNKWRKIVQDLSSSGLPRQSKHASVAVMHCSSEKCSRKLTVEEATEGCLVLHQWLNTPSSAGIELTQDERKAIRGAIREQAGSIPPALQYAYMPAVLSKPWQEAISAFKKATRTDDKSVTATILKAMRDGKYHQVSTAGLKTALEALDDVLDIRRDWKTEHGDATDSLKSAETAMKYRLSYATANIKDNSKAISYRLANRAFDSGYLGVDQSSAVMACVQSWSRDRMAHLQENTLRLGAEGLRKMAGTETKSGSLDELSRPALNLAELIEKEHKSRYGTERPCSTDGSVVQVSGAPDEALHGSAQPACSVEDLRRLTLHLWGIDDPSDQPEQSS